MTTLFTTIGHIEAYLAVFLIYGTFVVILLIATVIASAMARGSADAEEEASRFFRYVQQGRVKVADLESNSWLLGMYMLLLAFLSPAFVFSGALLVLFMILSVPAAFALFYVTARHLDGSAPKARDGIVVGYEYPHPVSSATHYSGNLAGRSHATSPAFGTRMLGAKGAYRLNMATEPNPHAMVIGETGAGKTTFVETLLARTYEQYKIPFLVVDWSGSYRRMKGYAKVWEVPGDAKVNPLLLAGYSATRRSGVASEMLMRTLELTQLQAQKLRDTLMWFYSNGKEPTLDELSDHLSHSSKGQAGASLQARQIANKLRQAGEVFGAEPADFWSSYDKRCNVLELDSLTDTEKNLVTHAILQRVIENFRSEHGTKLLIALDDAYQALLSYEGKESPITKIVREGRKYGFGLVISTQLLQDMPEAILGNTAVKYIGTYHESTELDRLHTLMGMSVVERAILYKLPTGSGFLFDQRNIERGGNLAYIEVDRLGDEEKARLAGSGGANGG